MATFKETSKSGEVMHLESVSPNRYYDDAAAQRGAAILEEERTLGVWQSAKLHWRALLICSVSFTAGMLFGYDTVANSASISMPAFFIFYGDIGPTGPYLPSIWTSLWTAMSALCQSLAAFVIGFFMDRYGRRWPACAAGALTMVGTAVQYTTSTRGALLAGKMVNGFGVGASLAVATSYASEVAPMRLRGPVQSCLVLFTVLMQGVALGIIRALVPNVHPQAFRDVFAIQWAVGGIVMIAFALAPESPIYLITNNHLDRAHKVMTKIYGPNNDVDARLANLIKTIQDEQSQHELESGSYIECFKGKDLKRTLTVVFLYTTSNMGGAAFLAQSIYFLIIAGLPAIHAFDVSIGGFGLACIIIVTTWFIGDRIRRRTGVMVGLVVNFLGMLTVGCLYYNKSTGALWAIAVIMNLLISLGTSLMQGMGWPIAAELSSYRLRAKTISIGVISQTLSTWFTTFTVPYMYNVDSGNLGARTGFVFAGTSIVLIVLGWLYIPDTTGMTAEEIDHAYIQNIAPKNFSNSVNSVVPVMDIKGADHVSESNV